MYIIPGIDLMNGKVVRLKRGGFDTAKQVADDPVKTAESFKDNGAKWIHVVDLDGARTGAPVHLKLVETIIRTVGINVEVGGGIRCFDTIQSYLEAGAARVILGSAAVQDPKLVYEAVARFGPAIAVGIDAKEGLVRAGGWLEESTVTYMQLAAAMDEAGISTLIYTDINRDGMLSGPNIADLESINKQVKANVIASGGIRNTEDVMALKESGMYGVIIGKALYDGLDLREVIEKTCQ